MSFTHSGAAVTSAIVARLTAGGVLVGRGEAPSTGGWAGTPGQSTFTPYTVVHPTIGGTTDGSIAEPDEDVSPDYTLTSVGATQQQCEIQCDKAVTAMFAAQLSISGGRVVSLLRYDQVAGVLRDDDVKPPVYFAPARFRIVTTPDTLAYP